jgi:hypothetical protein
MSGIPVDRNEMFKTLYLGGNLNNAGSWRKVATRYGKCRKISMRHDARRRIPREVAIHQSGSGVM